MLRMILTALQEATPQVTPQVDALLGVLRGEMSRKELQAALDLGLVEMTLPERPSSRLQKYRLTERGREISGAGDR